MSIRKIFEEELADLKTQLVEMCRLTEQMISDAITALVNRDRELGKSISVMDKRVDEYEMAIEKKCMRILLKQQPVAKDFQQKATAVGNVYKQCFSFSFLTRYLYLLMLSLPCREEAEGGYGESCRFVL